MLYALTFSGITLQLAQNGSVSLHNNAQTIGQCKGISHHPWRSHKPEYTLEECYASPELLTRAYLLLTTDLPVWLQSKIKAAWLEPEPTTDSFEFTGTITQDEIVDGEWRMTVETPYGPQVIQHTPVRDWLTARSLV